MFDSLLPVWSLLSLDLPAIYNNTQNLLLLEHILKQVEIIRVHFLRLMHLTDERKSIDIGFARENIFSLG